MYFVVFRRTVKVALTGGGQYDARSNNVRSFQFSGPFTKLATAERAAVNGLGTHTCLNAQVLTPEQIIKLSKSGTTSGVSHEMQQAALRIRKLFIDEE